MGCAEAQRRQPADGNGGPLLKPAIPPPPLSRRPRQVLAAKAEAKAKLQAHFRLLEGPQYDVIVFIGRICQQKGCDIIAKVAAGGLGRLLAARGRFEGC